MSDKGGKPAEQLYTGRGRCRGRAGILKNSSPPRRPGDSSGTSSETLEEMIFNQPRIPEKSPPGKRSPKDENYRTDESVPERGAHRGQRLDGPDIFSDKPRILAWERMSAAKSDSGIDYPYHDL